MEKLVLAFVTASRKLRHYFNEHLIQVLTLSLIKAALKKADLLGRTKKCSVELGKFHIEHESRMAIKGQILADFIAEFTGNTEVRPDNQLSSPTGGQEEEDTRMEITEH